jgi:hypothetical protein
VHNGAWEQAHKGSGARISNAQGRQTTAPLCKVKSKYIFLENCKSEKGIAGYDTANYDDTFYA